MEKYRDKKGFYHIKPIDKLEKERVSSYGIFLLGNEILLVKPVWIDKWEFPGGKVEEKESLLDALIREYREETGFKILRLDEQKLFSVNTKYYDENSEEYFDSYMNYFKIDSIGNQDKSLIFKDEILEVKYIDLDDLNDENMNILHYDILKAIGLK